MRPWGTCPHVHVSIAHKLTKIHIILVDPDWRISACSLNTFKRHIYMLLLSSFHHFSHLSALLNPWMLFFIPCHFFTLSHSVPKLIPCASITHMIDGWEKASIDLSSQKADAEYKTVRGVAESPTPRTREAPHSNLMYMTIHAHMANVAHKKLKVTFVTWSWRRLVDSTERSPSGMDLHHRSCHLCGHSWLSLPWWHRFQDISAQSGSLHMQALAALSQRASLTGSELKRREIDIMDNSIKSRSLSRQFIPGSHCKYYVY